MPTAANKITVVAAVPYRPMTGVEIHVPQHRRCHCGEARNRTRRCVPDSVVNAAVELVYLAVKHAE